MIPWVTVAHNLWERPTDRRQADLGLVYLYNTVTPVTRFGVTTSGYVVLVVVTFRLAWLLIPQHYFADETVRRATFGYRHDIRARRQQRDGGDPYQDRTNDRRRT